MPDIYFSEYIFSQKLYVNFDSLSTWLAMLHAGQPTRLYLMSTSFLHKKIIVTLLFRVFLTIDYTSTHGKRVFESCTLIIYDLFINPACNNSRRLGLRHQYKYAKSLSCHLRHFIQKTDFSFFKLLPTCQTSSRQFWFKRELNIYGAL